MGVMPVPSIGGSVFIFMRALNFDVIILINDMNLLRLTSSNHSNLLVGKWSWDFDLRHEEKNYEYMQYP